MGMQAVTGFESGCCVCYHQWTAGLTGTQCCFGGYRALLPLRSRGRRSRVLDGGHYYEFEDVEERPVPGLRTTCLARECLAVVEAMGVGGCKGHKSAPLVAKIPGMEWYRIIPPELVHDTKVFVEMLLKTIVGKVTNAGFYNNWSQDDAHRRHNQIRGIFRSTWPGNDGPLPWRLTTEQRLFLDRRMATLCWPERIEKLYYDGASFWTKPCRMWKARRKFTLLYFILPCQLRDQVPAVRNALNVFVWAMRRLLVGWCTCLLVPTSLTLYRTLSHINPHHTTQGQVHSYENAVKLEILPGSRSIDKASVPALDAEVTKGLVLFNGCLPADGLNPSMHHFSHFGKYVGTHADLQLLWMMGFERLVAPSLPTIHNTHTSYTQQIQQVPQELGA